MRGYLLADIVNKETRSRMMSGIKGKNTKPEMLIRKGLHSLGFRYRLHDKKLPGKPDLVFPAYHAVIMVHGCFWHRHECPLFKWPSTRKEFWQEKIMGNVERDKVNTSALHNTGWRVLTIWECAVRGRSMPEIAEVITQAANWLKSGTENSEITGCN
jgi:DNA mismatch endonuclease (patch repair protein)